eukprot:566901-Alexandrium_andersonii.AAC.1
MLAKRHCRHHAMVLAISMATVRTPQSARSRSPDLSPGPFCTFVRARARTWQGEPPRSSFGA